MRFAALIFMLFIYSTILHAQQFTVIGRITSSDTKEALSGASVRIAGTNKGTYADSRGVFRLQAREGDKIEISSLGYRKARVSAQKDTLFISLSPSPVQIKGATAVGELSAENAVKRAIAKKKENVNKIKTMTGKIYTKMLLELDGSIFNTFDSDGKSVSVGGTIGMGSDQDKEQADKYKLWMTETFSELFIDNEKDIERRIITERRQTANMQPNNNIVALGKFMNFYDNTITILSSNFTTPLADGALNFYDYKMEEKTMIDDRYVYNISFTPKSTVFPGFVGKMKLLEGDYNVIEFELKPSPERSVEFVQGLKINQKFSDVGGDIWYPDYMEMSGKASVEAIKGLFDIIMNLNITAMVNDIKVNIPLPDSIYKDNRTITVSPMADSTKPEFWATESPRDLSERELMIYRRVDSLMALDTAAPMDPSRFNWSAMPALDYNRVSSLEAGAKASVGFKNFVELEGTGVYNTGQKKPFGAAKLTLYPMSRLTLSGSAFSRVVPMATFNRDWPRIINSAWFLISGDDYFDYYRSDGWNVEANYELSFATLNANLTNERSFDLRNKADYSFFKLHKIRENPQADVDNYLTLTGSVKGNLEIKNIKLDYLINGYYGSSQTGGGPYSGSMQELTVETPLFGLGFEPAKMRVKAGRGDSWGATPVQFLYRMRKSLAYIGRFGFFLTAPTSMYGGDYAELHAELDINDYWWRLLHLPRISNGRGIGLALNFSYGSFDGKGFYAATTNKPGDILGLKNGYIEAGFGLNRIPTFISNVIYLGFDARWRLTNQNSDKFGWAISVNFPF